MTDALNKKGTDLMQPAHIKETPPGVISEIERRARQSEIYRRGILAAVAGFDEGLDRPKKRTRTSQGAKSRAKRTKAPGRAEIGG